VGLLIYSALEACGCKKVMGTVSGASLTGLLRRLSWLINYVTNVWRSPIQMGSADGGPVRCALLLRRARKRESLSDALAVFCPKGAADRSGLRSGYVAAVLATWLLGGCGPV